MAHAEQSPPHAAVSPCILAPAPVSVSWHLFIPDQPEKTPDPMIADPSVLAGYPAAFLTTVAFLPQAIQSWRTRDLAGISLPMYSLFTSGVALWLVYGIAIGSLPIILANSVTLVLASMVLWLKIAFIRTGAG
jgi:MtN3 and saliva related transmembrane protein